MLTGLAIGLVMALGWAALFLTVLVREIDRYEALQRGRRGIDRT
jgi:hypothetical protein